MMNHLFLEDLKELDEAGVKAHLAEAYADDESGKAEVAKYLEDYIVVIAYESVGAWGCDSSSYFLLQHKETGQYQEFSGSHCSCFGFEGQFEPEETTIEYLKSDKFHLCCGGYNENETENQRAAKEFLSAL